MKLSVERASKIDELREWDDVAGVAGLYASASWLRFHEDPLAWGGAANLLPATYLLLREGKEPVAVAVCYRAASAGALPALTDVWAQYREATSAVYPLVHCGPPRGYASRLLVGRTLDGPGRKEVLARLVEEVKSFARESGAKSIAFGHLPSEDARELLDVEPSLAAVFSHSDTSLEVPATFDQYLARLSKRQRKNARRGIRGFEAAGFRIERPKLAEVLDPAARLIAGHERKYGINIDVSFARNWLASCVGRFEDRTCCLFSGDRMLGVGVFFHHRGVYYARTSGLDDAAIPKSAAAYMNLRFFEGVHRAIDEGVSRIHFGRESLETKVLYGYEVSLLWTLPGLLDGFPDAVRDALAGESTRKAAADEEILRRHHLPQLPDEARERMFREAAQLIGHHSAA